MRILLLADIHIGAIRDTNYVQSILDQIFLKEIHVKHTDLVVILGDYFDRLFKANEPYVTLAMNVMSRLVRTCVESSTSIRIVYGTESHEMNQYGLFSHFLSSQKIDMKLIRTQSEETIKGKRILYIPEEYVSDYKEFYRDTVFSNTHYDYIFGHGTIIEAMPESIKYAHIPKKENSVPRFHSQDLSRVSTITAFGHYHIHRDLDNVHYVGSLFRWKFGEEEPKGYAIIEDDQFHFIENKEAYTYKTYEISSTDEEDIKRDLSQIESENPSVFNSNSQGKVRLIFNPDSSPSVYEKIRTNLLRSNQISTVMKYTPTEEEDSIPPEEETLFEIIMSKSIPPTEKIKQFIEDMKNISIPVSVIDSYLQNSLQL